MSREATVKPPPLVWLESLAGWSNQKSHSWFYRTTRPTHNARGSCVGRNKTGSKRIT